MPVAAGSSRTRLVVDALEARDVPAGLTDTFDTPGTTLGAAWVEAAGADVFSVVAGAGVGGTPGVVSTGTSLTAGRAWQTAVVSADTGAAVRVKLDSLVPTLVFVRGTALDTNAPTYVAAAVTRGMTAEVWDVQAGKATVRGTVATSGASLGDGNGDRRGHHQPRAPTSRRCRRPRPTPSPPRRASAAAAWSASPRGNVSLDDFTVIPRRRRRRRRA